MLEMNARKLGVKVMKAPKCHPELAGEGIEYHWAAAKSYYQRLPVKKKRNRDNFRNLVRQGLTEHVLPKILSRKFGKRAREYILAYHYLHHSQQQTGCDVPLQHSIIDKVVKQFKCHRNAHKTLIGNLCLMLLCL